MTTDQLISKAIHAIRTDQPRLSQLYMRNALQQVDQHRKDLNPLSWKIRKMSEAFQHLGQAFQHISNAWTTLAKGFARARAAEARKSDYTLT